MVSSPQSVSSGTPILFCFYFVCIFQRYSSHTYVYKFFKNPQWQLPKYTVLSLAFFFFFFHYQCILAMVSYQHIKIFLILKNDCTVDFVWAVACFMGFE